MKKKISVFAVVIAFSLKASAQIFMAQTGQATFFSATKVEDITATSKKARFILNTVTQDLQTSIAMMSFIFEKPLMQEHFNENYVESEKFPQAVFKGKINEKTDFTKDGEYNVTVTGIMSMHGVDKEYTIPGKLVIKGEQITISSIFKVKFADHNIVIPSLYSTVIPPDTEVKINAVLEAYKKK
jgi:polyisoprenoid-binding protein YceI